MIMSRKAKEQRANLPSDLAAESQEVSRLYRPTQVNQSEEYVAAAKALNIKLKAAGFTSLLKVEK